jgi:nitrate reductase assembly molybdenum cofactor insertion protein NarJ
MIREGDAMSTTDDLSAARTNRGGTPNALRARASVFAMLARLLGPDPSGIARGDAIDGLRDALEDAQATRCLAVLDRVRDDVAAAPLDHELQVLTGRWIRWFDQGRIPPYEGSNVAGNAGGVTPRLADIAGFYRALGVRVRGDRPDHVVAELEFMALLLLREADATESDDRDTREVCDEVARAFLRDHLGTWLEAWAARVGSQPDLAPWATVATVAAAFVELEARQRNVVPLRSSAVLADENPLSIDDPDLPVCGDGDPDAFDG